MSDTNDRKEYLEAYTEYAKTLRAWLVAYGVGLPVLLLSNEEMLTKEIKPLILAPISIFLVGVALQVVIAAANKGAMWGMYAAECNVERKERRWYPLVRGFSESFWFDVAIDVLTVAAFAWGTRRFAQVIFR